MPVTLNTNIYGQGLYLLQNTHTQLNRHFKHLPETGTCTQVVIAYIIGI